MIVKFTAAEMYHVLHYASVIHETKQISLANKQINNRRYAKDIDDFSMHLIGVMGEAALCKELCIRYDPPFHKYGDDGNDIDYGGFNIQVKTASKYYGDDGLLYVNDIEAVPSDILVSACVNGPASVHLLGAISKDKFKRIMHKRDLGYGMRDCVYNHELLTIEQMDEWIQDCGDF